MIRFSSYQTFIFMESKRKWHWMKINNFFNSASLITAISSDGWHFSHVYKHSINSKLFEDFIKDLTKFIRLKYTRSTMKKVLVLDNAAIHKTSAVLNTMKENFELTYFIPSYSP